MLLAGCSLGLLFNLDDEGTCSSETLATFYSTTYHYSPEDSDLNSYLRYKPRMSHSSRINSRNKYSGGLFVNTVINLSSVTCGIFPKYINNYKLIKHAYFN